MKVHRGRGQNFPIFISWRYLVELGPRQLGLQVAEFFQDLQGLTEVCCPDVRGDVRHF